jgi:uncharacterized protein YidB (DUF937 family)
MEALMGLFDSLKDAAGGALAGGAGGAAGGEGVVGKLLGMGGAELPGLLDKLHVGGLGDIAKSWVAKGENKPITPDQVKKTLPEQVAGVAKQLNLSLDDAAALIAKYLPGIIDKVTPDGLVPHPEDLAKKVTGLLHL